MFSLFFTLVFKDFVSIYTYVISFYQLFVNYSHIRSHYQSLAKLVKRNVLLKLLYGPKTVRPQHLHKTVRPQNLHKTVRPHHK